MKKNRKKISVCLASFNGECYIVDQLKSILTQLNEHDEILIGDDNSKDLTVDKINSLKDPRIRILHRKKNLGYIKNFESLLEKATGDYIFLSDQDDIWPEHRVDMMVNSSIRTGKAVIVGKFNTFSQTTPKLDILNSVEALVINRGRLENLIRIFVGKGISNFGSCMMLEKTAKNYLLPFLVDSVSHDHHIALLSNIRRDVVYIENLVTFRRIHQNNITKNNRFFYEKIKTRLYWLIVLWKYFVK